MARSHARRLREEYILKAQERFAACLFVVGPYEPDQNFNAYRVCVTKYYYESTPGDEVPNQTSAVKFTRAYLRWLRREYAKAGKDFQQTWTPWSSRTQSTGPK